MLRNNTNAIIKRVDNVGKQLAKEIRESKQRKRGPKLPVEYRSEANIPRLISDLERYHRYSRARYLYGLIHPDAAVRDGMQVKLYSDVPLPTTSCGIKEIHYIDVSLDGTFAVAWTPAFIGTLGATQNALNGTSSLSSQLQLKQYQYSHLFYNKDNVGARENEGQWHPLPSYVPEIDFQRYRLVSALMKVQFVGPVLSQSGVMNSCATFEDIPPLIAWNTKDSDQNLDISLVNIEANKVEYTGGFADTTGYSRNAYHNLARYTNFQLVKNGLWNTTHNITASATGVECLYIPMDTTDTTFKSNGSYYDTKPYYMTPTATHYTVVDALQLNSAATPIKYIVTGEGFQNLSTKQIMIEVYYNFEIIADPTTAPFLRAAVNDYMDEDDNKTLFSSFKKWVKNNALIRGVRKIAPSFRKFITSHPEWFTRSQRWGNNVEPLLIGM